MYFSSMNRVVVSAILSTVLIAVIGIQNASSSSSSGGFTSINDNGQLTNDAHITVLSKTIRTVHSGFVVSHYELRGELRNDGTATSLPMILKMQIYDAPKGSGGRLVSTVFWVPDQRRLDPGETTTFAIPYTSDNLPNGRYWTYVAVGFIVGVTPEQ